MASPQLDSIRRGIVGLFGGWEIGLENEPGCETIWNKIVVYAPHQSAERNSYHGAWN
jgi:hypothetical protein